MGTKASLFRYSGCRCRAGLAPPTRPTLVGAYFETTPQVTQVPQLRIPTNV
ncbi:hypothetical protein Trisim1_001090 [Trichoderma cf. simile WF8]